MSDKSDAARVTYIQVSDQNLELPKLQGSGDGVQTSKTVEIRQDIEVKDLIELIIHSKKTSIYLKILEAFDNSSKLCCLRSKPGEVQESPSPKDTQNTAEADKMIAWLTRNLLKTAFQKPKPDFLDVFLLAVMNHQEERMEQLWKNLDGDCMATALIASTVLKKIAKLLERRQSMYHQSQVILSRSQQFETKAVNILHESFKDDPEKAHLLLVRRLEGMSRGTVLSFAYDGKHRNFMSNDCCQNKLKNEWHGEIPICTSPWKIIFHTIVPLFIICSNNTDSRREIGLKKEKLFSRFINFYRTPIIRFSLYMLSYLGFMCVFSQFIIIELPSKRRFLEYAVWAWTGSQYMEELRQVYRSWKDARFPCKFWTSRYFHRSWNILDQIIFGLLVLGAITRLYNNEHASNIYAAAFIGYVMRLLQYLYIIEAIGPKILIIRKMMKDFCFFLLIFVLFLIAFGVAFHSLVHPYPSDLPSPLHTTSNQEQVLNYIYQIVYTPYFVIFQQFDDLKSQISECINDTTPYTQADFEAGTAKCSRFATALYVVYVLITALLLVNLLIASFSSSYEQVAKDARQTWLYYRFEIICEYIDKPTLPPPFILLNYIWRMAHTIVYYKEEKQRRINRLNIKESEIQKQYNVDPKELKKLEKNAFDKTNGSDYEVPDDPNEDDLTSIKVTLDKKTAKLDRLDKMTASIDKLDKMTAKLDKLTRSLYALDPQSSEPSTA